MLRLTFLFLIFIPSFWSCQSNVEQPCEEEPQAETHLILGGLETDISDDNRINVNRPVDGQAIDFYHSVPIYYNRSPHHSMGRHIAKDGYNYGLKWQCVEFVKRFYYDHLNHEMPDTYGHAKHFFLFEVSDGGLNKQRNLRQFKNGGVYRPKVNDIIVFEGREYGHVAIISRVLNDQIEIVQQNVGRASRHRIKLYHSKGHYYIMNKAVLGWLGQRG